MKRLLAAGEGPPLVQLTKKRVGVFESDLYAWLKKRRRACLERQLAKEEAV
jgi:hypothetical protein